MVLISSNTLLPQIHYVSKPEFKKQLFFVCQQTMTTSMAEVNIMIIQLLNKAF